MWVIAFCSELLNRLEFWIMTTQPCDLHLTFMAAIRRHEWPLLGVFVPIVLGHVGLAKSLFNCVGALKLSNCDWEWEIDSPWKYFRKLVLVRLEFMSSIHEKGRACCESLYRPITKAFYATDAWCGLWVKQLPTQHSLFTTDHSPVTRHF